jgi:hypothetical protein
MTGTTKVHGIVYKLIIMSDWHTGGIKEEYEKSTVKK